MKRARERNFKNKYKVLQILGILNNALKPDLLQKQCRLKVYSILFIASLLYGCETWTLKQRDIKRLKTAEMKLRGTVGFRSQMQLILTILPLVILNIGSQFSCLEGWNLFLTSLIL
jgi:hypothetical protein